MLKTLLKSEISDEISESVVLVCTNILYASYGLWIILILKNTKKKMSLAYTFQGGYRALSWQRETVVLPRKNL